jgi:hypothetical protein
MEPYKRNAPFPEPSIKCLTESSVYKPSLQVPLTEPLQRERCSISKAFLDKVFIDFRVPSKGALPPGSLRAPIHRDAPFTEHSLTVNEPPSRLPKGAPTDREVISRAFNGWYVVLNKKNTTVRPDGM